MIIRYILLLLLLLIASPSQAQLLDDLVAYWKLDEASGNALDAHASNDLTDNNTVAATTGVLNNGRIFVAANSEKLNIADNAALSFGDEDMTLSFWYYKTENGTLPIFGKWDWGVGTDNEYLIRSSGAFLQFIVDDDGTGSAATVTSGSLADEAWYHVVAYHDATANEIGIIINDGTPVTTSYSSGINDGTSDFEIGGSNSGYMNGSIDEGAVWNRVLTSGEITSLYNSGSGLSYDSFGGGGDPNPLTPTLPGGTPDPLKRILP